MNDAVGAPGAPLRALAAGDGLLYSVVAGAAAWLCVPGVAGALGRRAGMEVVVFALLAAAGAFVFGTIAGLAIAFRERSEAGLAAALGRLWRRQLEALPLIVGLLVLWEFAMNPVVC